jgi:hypothetical protein
MKTTSIALIICLYAPLAWSQCSGISNGGGCVPPPCTPGSPLACNQQQQQGQQQAAPQPRAVWADRWGAIAVDENSGKAGTVEGEPSKSAANRVALEKCAENGGVGCNILLTFHNQCAAIAQNPGEGALSASGNPTKEGAEQDAIARCHEGNACKIVYSECSFAERVR